MEIQILRVGTSSEDEYLVSCARIRDIAVSRLVKELLHIILRDQLITAILDDEGKEKDYVRPRYARHFYDYKKRHL